MAILSVDIGTTNIKSLVYEDQNVVASFSKRITTFSSGLSERQDATFIKDYLMEHIETLKESYPLSNIVLSSPMHTLILLDSEYNPVSNMYLWSDRSGEDMVLKYKEDLDSFYQINGTPNHAMTPLTKLLKLRESESLEAYGIADLKSYIMKHLCGEFVTDVSSASASGLYDQKTRSWSEVICEFCGISKDQLPEVVEIDTRYFNGLTLTIGSTDGVMANRGTQIEPNQLVLSVGTSVGVRNLYTFPKLHPQGKSFSYDAGLGKWLNGNASNNGGNLFDWLSETYYGGTLSFEHFIEIVCGKLTDLYATPFVYGERGPWWVAQLKQDFLNLEAHHTSEDKVQSIILAMFSNIDLMIDSLDNTSEDPILLTGGFLRDERLIQCLSDYLQKPLASIVDENAVCHAGVLLIEPTMAFEANRIIEPQLNQDLVDYKNKSKAYLKAFVEMETL